MISADTFTTRRASLLSALPSFTADSAVVFFAGAHRLRNAPDLQYPFRCSSNVLYFAGNLPPGALLVLCRNRSIAFVPDVEADEVIWHGESETEEEICARSGLDEVLPFSSARKHVQVLSQIFTVGAFEATSREAQLRAIQAVGISEESGVLQEDPEELIHAIIELRLLHDQDGRAELRRAAEESCVVFEKTRAQLASCASEYEVASYMQFASSRYGGTAAFPTIATQQPQVLHASAQRTALEQGAVLLLDFGLERPSGYCADISRTILQERAGVPAQTIAAARAVLRMLKEVHDRCCAQLRPGVRFLDIQVLAEQLLAEGLADLGVLRSSGAHVQEAGVISHFFPHGVGHAIGLDAHDMHEFGDAVGYPKGRQRDTRFGRRYLRFDRDLQEHMAVTIEPGCYFSPPLLDALLSDPRKAQYVDVARLEKFASVGGARIEDTILLTKDSAENLCKSLPKVW